MPASSARDTTTKSVIFSQWTSFLDVIEKAVKRAGFQHVRLDGKMPRKKRDAAIKSFQKVSLALIREEGMLGLVCELAIV